MREGVQGEGEPTPDPQLAVHFLAMICRSCVAGVNYYEVHIDARLLPEMRRAAGLPVDPP